MSPRRIMGALVLGSREHWSVMDGSWVYARKPRLSLLLRAWDVDFFERRRGVFLYEWRFLFC